MKSTPLVPIPFILDSNVDLSNFKANRSNLERMGAFQLNTPEVYSIDQLDLEEASRAFRENLGNDTVTIAIDDGCHSIESIEITFQALHSHLSNRFVYFIEDNFDTYDRLAHRYRQYRWHSRGELTVATR